ncbi:Translocon-associated complex TRAP, beta subunit [Handroanthus impetiginosus]|uniref:Translocon-associated complex TRAP, beta subunit n=1 Tax=Handroanthus impetiginosus TaxID=429701 RepID=A0A2G9HA46_9LAMI|nr:Translocon-associated complex TRAP, beta subunit [Handroanthus impetiginosus]
MAKAFRLAIFAALSMIFICSPPLAESANSPFIVVHKRVSSRKLNSDLERVSVSIDIYNTGSDTAYDVTLTDDTWAVEVFDSIVGNTSKTWERLDVGSLASHSFELESKVKTVYYGAPALITYRIPTKSKLQEAYSTPILPIKILAEPTTEKRIEIRLVAKYGSHVSVVLLIILFAQIILSPSKASPANGNKKRH